MDIEEYQNFVSGTTSARIIEKDDLDFEVSWAVHGLNSEAGEISGVIAKYFRKHGELTEEALDKIKDELGDTLWYLTATCNAIGINLQEVINFNVSKLTKRDKEDTINDTSR